MLQLFCMGTLFPITRNLLGKQLGWFLGSRLTRQRSEIISLRENTLPKPRLSSLKPGLSQLGEEQLQADVAWR